jgi:hypothetical protein
VMKRPLPQAKVRLWACALDAKTSTANTAASADMMRMKGMAMAF